MRNMKATLNILSQSIHYQLHCHTNEIEVHTPYADEIAFITRFTFISPNQTHNRYFTPVRGPHLNSKPNSSVHSSTTPLPLRVGVKAGQLCAFLTSHLNRWQTEKRKVNQTTKGKEKKAK